MQIRQAGKARTRIIDRHGHNVPAQVVQRIASSGAEMFRKRQATAASCLPALAQWIHTTLGFCLQTYLAMAEAYDRYGYNLIGLVPGGPGERTEFILSCL